MKGLFLFSLAILAIQVQAEGDDRPEFRPRTKANQCTPLDARKAKPGLADFYAIPKSQDSLGWCYASAAADLYSHKLGVPVSSVDLALSYNRDIQKSPRKRSVRTIMESLGINRRKDGVYQSGFISEALKDGKVYGLCPASRIPSKTANSEGQFEMWALLKSVNELPELLRNRGLGPEQFKRDMECFEKTGGTNVYTNYFPGLDMGDLYELLVREAGEDVNKLMFELAQQHCAGHRFYPPKNLKIRRASPENWFHVMDSQLKRGNILGIEFFTRMLRGKKVGALEGHSVSVVARDFIKGECRYLLRNSWVTGCSPYSNELQPYCDDTQGTVWVSEKQMKPYLKSVVHLE